MRRSGRVALDLRAVVLRCALRAVSTEPGGAQSVYRSAMPPPKPIDDPILDLYVSDGPVWYRNRWRHSGLYVALRDARRAQGLDQVTGAPQPGGGALWAGALAHLTVIEQIGRAVRRTDMRAPRAHRANGHMTIGGKRGPSELPFASALVQFTDLGDRHISALYALRCAFAHSFGLVNVHKSRDDLTHRFLLTDSRPELVRLPHTTFDRSFGFASSREPFHRMRTCVDVVQLAQLLDSMVANVVASHVKDHLARTLPSEAEFIQRHTVVVLPDPSKRSGSA